MLRLVPVQVADVSLVVHLAAHLAPRYVTQAANFLLISV
jgi:hypothetical protein